MPEWAQPLRLGAMSYNLTYLSSFSFYFSELRNVHEVISRMFLKIHVMYVANFSEFY